MKESYRKRQAKRPPKVVHAAMHMEHTPHMNTLKEKKVAAGTFCRQYAAGPIKARPPKKGAEPTQE